MKKSYMLMLSGLLLTALLLAGCDLSPNFPLSVPNTGSNPEIGQLEVTAYPPPTQPAGNPTAPGSTAYPVGGATATPAAPAATATATLPPVFTATSAAAPTAVATATGAPPPTSTSAPAEPTQTSPAPGETPTAVGGYPPPPTETPSTGGGYPPPPEATDTPVPGPTAAPTEAPTAAPTSTSPPSTGNPDQGGGQGGSQGAPAIRFRVGETGQTILVTLSPAGPALYRLNARAGQHLTVTISGNGTPALTSPGGANVPASMPSAGQWQFDLPQNGDYLLALSGSGQATVSISILPPLAELPGYRLNNGLALARRIRFLPGTDSATLGVTLSQGVNQTYFLRVFSGQTLSVTASAGVTVDILWNGSTAAGGGGQAPNNQFWAVAPATGDFAVVVSGDGPATLTFYIPPIGSAP